jgi:hypothetical protein
MAGRAGVMGSLQLDSTAEQQCKERHVHRQTLPLWHRVVCQVARHVT